MKRAAEHIILLFLLAGTGSCFAQDLHFSQYFNAPLLINPANTGFMPDQDYRVGVNYRNQWSAVGGNPYKTMSAWGDAQLFNNSIETGWVGLGGAILKDVAGSGNLSSTKGFVSVAYHQLLNANSLLSVGFGLGLSNQRVDLTKLTFDDQWNGRFFDISIPSNENFVTSSVTYMDLQVGLNYAYFVSDNLYLNAGVSVMHLNRPRESFFAETPTGTDQIDRRYTGFINASIKVQDIWIVNPNVYVSKMGNAWETVLGVNAQRDLVGDGSTQLILGLYFRNNDALIPMVGYEVNGLKLTFNYDATISSLGPANGTQGAYEFSIVKSGIFGGVGMSGRAVKCPKAVRF